MIFDYDTGITAQQRRWIEDAITACSYPLAGLEVDVTFTVAADPPAPGHKDYMCVEEDSPGSFTVTIREGADDPTRDFNRNIPNPPQNIRAFFRESVVHELMHVVAMVFLTSDSERATIAGAFYRRSRGEGMTPGELADWNPLDRPWEDRIQEAFAEVMKDTFLEDSARVYDNRTNWEMFRALFEPIMAMVVPVGTVYIPLGLNSNEKRRYATQYSLDNSPANPEDPWTGWGYDRADFTFRFTTGDDYDHNIFGDYVLTNVKEVEQLVVDIAIQFPPGRPFPDDGPGTNWTTPASLIYNFGEIYEEDASVSTVLAEWELRGQRDGGNVKLIDAPPTGYTYDPPLVRGDHIGLYPPGTANYRLKFNEGLIPGDPTKVYEVWMYFELHQGQADEPYGSDVAPYDDLWFWDVTERKVPQGAVGTGFYGTPSDKLSVKVSIPGEDANPQWPYEPPELTHRSGGAGFMRL